MRFRDTNRQLAKTVFFQLLQLFYGRADEIDTVRPIDAFGDCLNLFFDRRILAVDKAERFLDRQVAKPDDFLRQLDTALAALGPHLGQGNVDAVLLAFLPDKLKLCFRIIRESINGNDNRAKENIRDIPNVLGQVFHPLPQGFEIFFLQVTLGDTTVHFERSDGRHQNDGGRVQP